MRRHIITVIVTVVVALITAACGDDAPTPTAPTVTPTPTVTPDPVTLTGLSMLAPTSFLDNPELTIGASVQFELDAEYSDGTTRRVTNEATWVSSQPTVASVSSGGRVTGLMRGTVSVVGTFEDQNIRSIRFRVERGRHVTVRNVRMESSSSSFYRVKGTVINSGTVSFSGFLEMHARFFDGGGLLLSDDRDYIETGGTFAVDAQRTFDILVRKSDTTGWAYYTVAFIDGADREVACAGCDEQRGR